MRGAARSATWLLLATLTSWSNRALADDASREAEARLLLDEKKPLTAGVLLAPSLQSGSASSQERELFATSLSDMGLKIVAIEFFPPEATEALARESAIVDLTPALMLAGWTKCSSSGRRMADSAMAIVFRHFVAERAIIEVQTHADWVATVAPLARFALHASQGRWFEATALERTKRLEGCVNGR